MQKAEEKKEEKKEEKHVYIQDRGKKKRSRKLKNRKYVHDMIEAGESMWKGR